MLRSATILFLLMFFPLLSIGKKKHKVTTTDIAHISDSLLRVKIGDTLFPFCKPDKSAYYSYRKGKGVQYKELFASEKLHRRFQRAFIRYQFSMPYGACALYDTVRGVISIELEKQDSILAFAAEPDISFIPEMAIAQEPCSFIEGKKAIDIAIKDSLVLGITEPYAILKYQPESKSFSWIVISLTWKENNFNDESEPEKDVVFIDALSGEVRKHKKIAYHQLSDVIY